jgi:hypothetical protein
MILLYLVKHSRHGIASTVREISTTLDAGTELIHVLTFDGYKAFVLEDDNFPLEFTEIVPIAFYIIFSTSSR